MKELQELARLWNVQTSYDDVTSTRRSAEPDTILAVLRALGAGVSFTSDIEDAITERREQLRARALEPVTASWDGTAPSVLARLPAGAGTVTAKIEMENGGERSWEVDVRALTPVERDDRHVTVALPVEGAVPLGYHTVRVGDAETMLVRAPSRMPQTPPRAWGVFVPLYALRTARDWGSGDLGDLRALLKWVEALGGNFVGTLPLLARFDDDPSPYSPVSRLYWDEMWLDLGDAPQDVPRSTERVDHDRVRALKRRALLASDEPVAEPDERLDAYARFRAAGARHGRRWPSWPENALHAPDMDEYTLHVRAQQLARTQLRALSSEPVSLVFDLPLGVHQYGFDTWAFRDSFALGVHGGAPPDSFFTKGQDWDFAPLHPERIRENRYAYPIACMRALMEHARVLRIDHVMGFHRLWWIPPGASPDHGAYVRYHADEWYAILALEARRHDCVVVGEDLGTVPREVRRSMGRHRVLRTYVVQEEVTENGLNPIPSGSIASLNTHDMPPFASYWRGLDIDKRREMGLLDEHEAEHERARRASLTNAVAREVGSSMDERDVLRALLRSLASSRARIVMPALEDLWGETEPQNIPGTGKGFGNWERRARYPLEEIPADVSALLRDLGDAR
ncbi:MAG: 4-alpha-glucanotransferase [Actinobacteria bacterium]|nr:4-alpha-glucanotransferase [Actinomycetota bacterium]